MHPPGQPQRPEGLRKEACKWRHLMENFFARIKEYRGSATRHDKTDSNDAANWNLAATLLASRQLFCPQVLVPPAPPGLQWNWCITAISPVSTSRL